MHLDLFELKGADIRTLPTFRCLREHDTIYTSHVQVAYMSEYDSYGGQFFDRDEFWRRWNQARKQPLEGFDCEETIRRGQGLIKIKSTPDQEEILTPSVHTLVQQKEGKSAKT